MLGFNHGATQVDDTARVGLYVSSCVVCFMYSSVGDTQRSILGYRSSFRIMCLCLCMCACVCVHVSVYVSVYVYVLVYDIHAHT